MPPQDRATLDATNLAMAGLAFGQLAIAVLGVLVITSEYSTGGIKTTLIAVPEPAAGARRQGPRLRGDRLGRRHDHRVRRVLRLDDLLVRHDLAAHLGDPGVLRAVLGGGLLVLASGMFGFAIGVADPAHRRRDHRRRRRCSSSSRR